jgi:aspartate carbamoyltransferase regulatory subunit
VKELKVSKIQNGTVIDHIRAGMSPLILRILGIGQEFPDTVILAMNVSSRKYGRKDIVKVENRELSSEMINKIALVAPHATINIIRNFEVVKKIPVSLPDRIERVVRCPNRRCITNSSEGVDYLFRVESRSPIELRCYYCERLIGQEEIEIL